MTMETFYLICFVTGFVLSVATAMSGLGHLHFGHIGRLHFGHSAGAHQGTNHGLSAFNGFTITAFLCWFGGAGYVLYHYTGLMAPMVFVLATLSGVIGAMFIWSLLFKVLLPRERVLTAEDTEMTGVLAEVSDSIRSGGGVGEILYVQTGARRSAAARSEDGRGIDRGTEVVVMRYERGIAYVRPWEELGGDRLKSLENRS
jgi:membrane protein implicated in regulation of membrane protease activity